MNSWVEFCQDANLVDARPQLNLEDLQTIFIAANHEENRASADSKVNFDR